MDLTADRRCWNNNPPHNPRRRHPPRKGHQKEGVVGETRQPRPVVPQRSAAVTVTVEVCAFGLLARGDVGLYLAHLDGGCRIAWGPVGYRGGAVVVTVHVRARGKHGAADSDGECQDSARDAEPDLGLPSEVHLAPSVGFVGPWCNRGCISLGTGRR